MQIENSATSTSISDDLPTELKPMPTMRPSLERQSEFRGVMGSSFLLAGSGGSSTSTILRCSRFNDLPLMGCAATASTDSLRKTGDDDFASGELPGPFDTISSGRIDGKAKPRKSGIAVLKQNVKKIRGIQRFTETAFKRVESTKELLQRRMNRVSSSFFTENPPYKVPRFDSKELILGEQLGEGEFGSVYEIDRFLRRGSSVNWSAIGSERSETSMGSLPGAPVGASITLPTSTDLTVGKGNLDRFVERRIEEFSNELTTPTIMEDEERVDSHGHTQNGGSSQLLGTTDSGKGGDDPVLRRPGIQAIDEKGQMIKHQNNANDFDGYVVKVVRNNVENDRKKREAAVDMAFEAKLMSALAHPNIISIRGVLGYIENPNHYGLIMDKLRSTLQGQIQEWAKASSEDSVSTACPENNPLLGHIPQWMLLTKHEKDKQRQYFRQTAFFVERLEALLDVAKAMRYLHEKKIVFRDLKPENVGLTLENYVLFDFGLSRELTDKDRVGDAEDEYHATGLTGSRLFMAPEVALKKPYGFSADIFSFAILFWEVASLKEVFPNLTMNKHFKQVIVRGKRPASLKDTLPANLNEMMEAAWDKNPSNRPTSESICETLTKSLEKRLSQTTSTMLRDISWKSTESGPKSWRPNESSHGSAKTKKNLGQQLEHALDKFHMPTNKFWTSERHVNTHSNGVHRQNRTSL